MPGFCSVCLPQLLQGGIGEPPLIPLLLALLQPELWFPHGADPWGCQELTPLLLLQAEPFPPFQSLCYFPSLPYFWPCWPHARHPPNGKKSSGSGEGGQSPWDASRGSIPADERAFGATTRPRRATGVPACPAGWLHGVRGEQGTGGTRRHLGGAGCHRLLAGHLEGPCAMAPCWGQPRGAPSCYFWRPGASSRQLLPFYF